MDNIKGELNELFDGLFFSNGQQLTSTSIYKILLYQIMNGTMFSYIKGGASILYDDIYHEDTGIIDIVDKNTLKIVYNRQIDYCDLFSNIEFSPIYFNENNCPSMDINDIFTSLKDEFTKDDIDFLIECLGLFDMKRFVHEIK